MKNIFFLFLIIILATNCSILKMHTPQGDYTHLPLICQHEIKKVTDDFFYNKKYEHFILNGNAKFLQRLMEKRNFPNIGSCNCLSLLKPADIRDIFGEPSIEMHNGLYYFLNNPVAKMRCVLLFFKDKPILFIGNILIEYNE
jgi:hypothetical protein